MKPTLKFFAGLWTLRGYPEPEHEWSLEEKFAEVKRRGFDAIGGKLLPEAPALCAAHGLEYILFLDADSTNYVDELRRAVAWRPRRVNVQLCDHETPPEEAARIWIEMEALARDLGLSIDLELHRDTATETPEKTFAIADHFHAATGRSINFCLDFSHFAVSKHLLPPFAPRLLARPDVITVARQLHLRPFNGHHAQVPATNGRGQLTPECRDYLAFVERLFALIQSCTGPHEIIYACPENGPPDAGGYSLSCFPDVWEDAVRIRDETKVLWGS